MLQELLRTNVLLCKAAAEVGAPDDAMEALPLHADLHISHAAA